MVQVYGLVLTGLFTVVIIPSVIALLILRNHPLIKCRNPFFLILQSIGAFVAATLQSLYIGLRPDYSCKAFFVSTMLVYAICIFPLGIRVWEYCVNFHLAKVRAKFRSNELLPNWGTASWFFRNRWASRMSFLRKFYFVGLWIFIIPIIPDLIISDSYDYNEVSGGCRVIPAPVYASIAFAVIFFIGALFLVKLLWNSRDAYRIKDELKFLSLMWLIIIVIWIPYSSFPFHFQRTIPSPFWIILGLYFTHFTCALFPLYLIYTEEKIDVGEAAAGFKEFIDKLEFLPFRNAFHDFLSLQFCQENILFYETVMDWKRMPANDPQRVTTAINIRENYILETGLCQVNISGPQREKIAQALNKEDVPSDVFDESLAAVLSNMHTNSYYQFKAHHLYFSAKL